MRDWRKWGLVIMPEKVFLENIRTILSQGNDNLTPRQRAKNQEKYDEFIGKGRRATSIDVDDEKVGFDYLVCDEAHNFKKVFTVVRGEAKSSQKADTDRVSFEKTEYSISSGLQSARAIKLFFFNPICAKQSTQRKLFAYDGNTVY